MSETHPGHSVVGTLQTNQPWGNARLNLSVNQYLHDPGKYNVQIGGNGQWRVFRGFSLNLNGNYTRVRDQLFLPRGGLSDDEILTQQRSLATGYRYFGFFGVSYRFGSVTNNAVNPRFGRTSREATSSSERRAAARGPRGRVRIPAGRRPGWERAGGCAAACAGRTSRRGTSQR
jgi:hypothetical protein